jgi:formate hydrogenlyase subunit 4
MAQIVLDGIKLYSKSSIDILILSSCILLFGGLLSYLICIFIMLAGNGIIIFNRFYDLLIATLLLGLCVQLAVILVETSVSRYIHVGISRAIKASILSDITLMSS